MDHILQLQHLAEAEQHIVRGAQHVADQELRIADLDRGGHDSRLARSVLETFRLIYAQHIAHRDLIRRELEL